MSDLISRQAAIDEIKAVYEWHDYITIERLIEHIRKLPSAQPYTEAEIQKMQELEQAELDKAFELGKLDAESRWVPCSERLPEVHESGNSFSGIFMQSIPVLVYGICEGEENAQFHVATYCDDLDGTTYWSTELDALTVTCVKAWMPLPEPYREEGTE